MKISTFFIIKQYNVHLIIFSMIEVCVSTHIIGRILEENHMFIITIQNHALFGNLMTL